MQKEFDRNASVDCHTIVQLPNTTVGGVAFLVDRCPVNKAIIIKHMLNAALLSYN